MNTEIQRTEKMRKKIDWKRLPEKVVFTQHSLDCNNWYQMECVNKNCNNIVGYLNGLTPLMDFGILCLECAKKLSQGVELKK